LADRFEWPSPHGALPPTVGDCLFDLMSERGWLQVEKWRQGAKGIAPTLVGGSKKHGGPDLGPTRAKQAWAALGGDGHGLADLAPDPGYFGDPRLTTRMTARLQGFPDNWLFSGKKTAAYRQIGNAFPPPVALAVGQQIYACLTATAHVHLRKP
jgi:DNA (cytosine-5)-methyltransferase 1